MAHSQGPPASENMQGLRVLLITYLNADLQKPINKINQIRKQVVFVLGVLLLYIDAMHGSVSSWTSQRTSCLIVSTGCIFPLVKARSAQAYL
jgi:hypothetical protein